MILKALMQPKIDNIDETSQKGKYIQQIRKKFDALSGETEPGSNKKIERIFKKANISYSGNLRRVTDSQFPSVMGWRKKMLHYEV